MDCSPPGSSVHGTLQARVLEWVANAFSKINIEMIANTYIVVVQSLSCVQLFGNTMQASVSSTISQSLLEFTSIEMLSKHLILYCPLLLWPSIFPSIRVFSSESALRIRWPKYWRFSFSIGPSNESSWLVDQIQMDCVCLVYGVLLFKLVILLGIKRENME